MGRLSLACLLSAALLSAASVASAQYAPGPPPPPPPGPGYGYPDALPPVLTSAHLRVGGVIPVGNGYADAVGGGIAIDAAVWIELPYIAIEPRIGLRFDAVRSRNSYAEVPIDIGVFYLLGRGAAGVLIGGGIGARHIWDTRAESFTVGQVLQATTDRDVSDSGWGFGVYGRLGLMLGRPRGRRGRFTISAEINTTFATINGAKNPTAVVIAVGGLY